MKKLTVFLAMAVVFLAITTTQVMAEPKWVDVKISCDANGNVTIGAMPKGIILLNVYVYDDERGIPEKAIGPKTSYKLESGQGTNFFYKNSKGESLYQMITPGSKAPGFWTDCSSSGGCKYTYIKK